MAYKSNLFRIYKSVSNLIYNRYNVIVTNEQDTGQNKQKINMNYKFIKT